jgi:chromosomal replication initiation ATPase DnaA
VFKTTALPLVEHVLNGFSGTYFVYGQTGTGKTHTMGVLTAVEPKTQGIIPNSLDYLFKSLKAQKDL